MLISIWLAGWASKLPPSSRSMPLRWFFPNSFAGHQFSRTNSRLGLVWKSAAPKMSWLIRWSIIFPSFFPEKSSLLWPFLCFGRRLGTQLGFFLGPSVIDSSFQALMALADADVGIGSLKIPLSIKRCGLGPGWRFTSFTRPGKR